MSRVLAFVDHSPSAAGVVAAATSLAAWVGAAVDVIFVAEPGSPAPPEDPHRARVIRGEPETVLLDELQCSDVAFGVLGSRSVRSKPEGAGHVTLALLAASPVPLVLIPPDSRALPTEQPRLLLPLDGAMETTTALAPVANLLSKAGAVIIVLHVFNSSTIPPVLESSHDLDILAEEFLLQHVPGVGEACELRIGQPALHIVDVTDEQDVDAVLVAWRQALSPGRAEVLRHLVREIHVPLVIVPIHKEHSTPS
jgi:hypothetical protein